MEEKNMIMAGVSPRDGLGIKKEFPKNKSTLKTVYNAKNQMKITKIEGRSVMQYLTKLLKDNIMCTGIQEMKRRIRF